jgi:hypothetical protein
MAIDTKETSIKAEATSSRRLDKYYSEGFTTAHVGTGTKELPKTEPH